MVEQPAYARAWLAQRLAGEARIVAIERDELRRLDPAEALRLADALLAATPLVADSRRSSSGFVEQQRRFRPLRP